MLVAEKRWKVPPREVRHPRLRSTVRWALTGLWVVGLCLIYTRLFLYLHNLYNIQVNPYYTLTFLSIVRRSFDAFWLMSSLPPLAFAMAWHAWTLLPGRLANSSFIPRARHLTLIHVYGALCTAICLNVVVFRLWMLVQLSGAHLCRESGALALLDHGSRNVDPLAGSPGSFLFIVVAGTALVLLQSLYTVKALTGHLRGALIGFGLLLAIVVVVPVTSAYRLMPWLISDVVWTTDNWPPVDRSFLLDGSEPRGAVRDHLRTFFLTHDRNGQAVPTQEIYLQRERTGNSTPEFARWCDEFPHSCLLPETVLLSTRGVGVALSTEPPATVQPTLVIEIPFSCKEARIYQAGPEPSYRVIPLGMLDRVVPAEGWIVLKLDAEAEMCFALRLLMGLRDLGVRRVLLAAHSVGLVEQDQEVLIRFADQDEAKESRPYRWSARELGARRIYVPPPPKFPHIRSPRRSPFDKAGTARDWWITQLGGLPEAVALALTPQDRDYQFLIMHIDRAIAGGAKTIYLPEPED